MDIFDVMHEHAENLAETETLDLNPLLLTREELEEVEYSLVKNDTFGANPLVSSIVEKIRKLTPIKEETITLPKKEVIFLGMHLDSDRDSYTFYESEIVGHYITREEFDRRKD